MNRFLITLDSQTNRSDSAHEIWPIETASILAAFSDTVRQIEFVATALSSEYVHAVSKHFGFDEVVYRFNRFLNPIGVNLLYECLEAKIWTCRGQVSRYSLQPDAQMQIRQPHSQRHLHYRQHHLSRTILCPIRLTVTDPLQRE